MASHDLSPEEVHWGHLVALFGAEPNGFEHDRPSAMAFAAHDAYWDWYDEAVR
jgi:hypothetical protein